MKSKNPLNFSGLVLIFISLGAPCKAQGQKNSPDSLKHLLESYANKFRGEKIYTHTDKPYYYLGDTIWFKVYLTEATLHLPDTLSKVIYIDLVRKDNGNIILHKLLKNENGFAWGEMPLADTLTAGAYEMVCFTNWMRNFSSNFFFRKEIKIYKLGDLNENSFQSTEQLNDVVDLQFFPEGGNLIAGLQNRIAFKAVNQFGKGVDFKAKIISSHGDTLVSIASQHLGMGSFVLTPKANEKYSVIIEKYLGKNQFHLPPASANGYTFRVDNLSDSDVIQVIAKNNFSHGDRPILIGHQRGEVVYALQSETTGNSFEWTLPKKDIKENGVVQLTLFTAQGFPQCERLVYNQVEPNLQISIISDKSEYKPREKIKLSIKVLDQDDYPVIGNFSLSVTDTQQVTHESNGENIYSYFYLTSDVEELIRGEIRGTIEQPDYYFKEPNLNVSSHLDILLMTQGWRRFLWRKLLNNDMGAPKYKTEKGITLQGKVVSANGKQLLQQTELVMSYSSEEKSIVINAKTDPAGKFSTSTIDAYNQTKIFLQKSNEKKSHNYILSIDQPELQFYPPRADVNDSFTSSESFHSFLQRQRHVSEIDSRKVKNSTLLKELVLTAKREKKNDPRKIMYEGTNATTVVVNQQMCASAASVIQLLQGRVAGLQISQDSTGGYVAVMRGPRSFLGHTYPTVLVDGVITDMQYLSALSPCAIESIDVVTHPVASLNAQGLIAILTKGGSNAYRDWSQPESATGTLAAIVQGYDMPREFYSPKYSGANAQAQIPDLRSTLYWNPAVKTDADGNAKVIFWNSDEITSFRVGIEGITNTGKPGHAAYTYRVKKTD